MCGFTMKASDCMEQSWPKVRALTRGRYFEASKKVFHDLSLLFVLVSTLVFYECAVLQGLDRTLRGLAKPASQAG
jgi:hypothetical protein